MAENTFVSVMLIAVVTTYLFSVGTSTSPEDNACVKTCNLRQGYCAPEGCRCYPGYEGDNCDTCTRAPGCLHGTCHQAYQCNCKPGWGGLRCDKDMKICERTQPCKNEATCINVSGDYTCVCQKGFTGKHCEIYTPEGMPKSVPTTEQTTTKNTRIPVVLPRECQHGGRCLKVGAYKRCEKCICKPGYVGKFCEVNVNECLLRPCANGGKCFDLSNDFFCQCEKGFTGRYCEKDIDECALSSNICYNGGICNNTYGSYDCACRKGYTGFRCGDKIMSPTIIKVPDVRTKTPDVKPFTPKLMKVITNKIVTEPTTTTIEATQTTKRSRKVIKNPESEVKMTRITHELKISSVNGEYSASNNELLIRQEIERDSNVSNTSTQAMQAMTFVFMGLAIVILAAILALVWLRCFRNQVDADCSKNKNRSDSPDCEAPPTPSVISSVDQYVTNNRMPTYETVVMEHEIVDEQSDDDACMQIQPCLTNEARSSNEVRQSVPPTCNSPPPSYAMSAVDRIPSSRPISSGYYVALPPMTQQRSRQNISESRKSLTTSYGMTSHEPEETSSLLEADSPTLSHKIVV